MLISRSFFLSIQYFTLQYFLSFARYCCCKYANFPKLELIKAFCSIVFYICFIILINRTTLVNFAHNVASANSVGGQTHQSLFQYGAAPPVGWRSLLAGVRRQPPFIYLLHFLCNGPLELCGVHVELQVLFYSSTAPLLLASPLPPLLHQHLFLLGPPSPSHPTSYSSPFSFSPCF